MKTTVKGKTAYFEIGLTLVFVLNSLAGILFREAVYPGTDLVKVFYVNDWLNVVFGIVMLIVCLGLVRLKDGTVGFLRMGFCLFMLYNAVPVMLVAGNPVSIAVEVVIVSGCAAAFILRNRDMAGAVITVEMRKWLRILISVFVMAFAVIFIARGVMNIGKYLSGDLGRSDFAVSVSDMIVSLVWLACGILFLADRRFGNGNIVPVLFQSSLLYVGLIIYLIVTPIVYREGFDWGGIVVIVIMSLFFIVPLFLTAGKVRLFREE